MNRHPTRQTYDELEQAFDFFNKALFEDRLPHCLITLQRQHDTYGYFSRDRFVSRDGSGERTHEIALNPSYFAIRSIPETLSVLAREMVSLDQTLNGTPGRRRYHNKEWAEMLEAIGLMPTDTGLPGGKRTGEKVEHYIIEDGAFDVACRQLVNEAFTLSWVDRYPPMPDTAAVPEDEDEPSADGASSGVPDVVWERATEAGKNDLGRVVSFAPAATPEGEAGDIPNEDDSSAIGSILEGPNDGAIFHGLIGGTNRESQETDQEGAGEVVVAPMKRFAPVAAESLEKMGVEVQERKQAGSRMKYRCPSCGNQVWGKPGMQLGCYDCELKPALGEVPGK